MKIWSNVTVTKKEVKVINNKTHEEMVALNNDIKQPTERKRVIPSITRSLVSWSSRMKTNKNVIIASILMLLNVFKYSNIFT